MQLAQLAAHELAELGVQRAERLVHQEGLGRRTMARPSATRCRSPPARPETGLIEQCSIRSSRAASSTRARISARGTPLHRSGKPMFCAHVHVRVEREQLEHEGDVALARRAGGDVLAVEQDPARGRQFEAGDHAQGRRLAAAGGPEQDEELAVRDGEVDRGRGEIAEPLLQVSTRISAIAPQSGNLADDDEQRRAGQDGDERPGVERRATTAASASRRRAPISAMAPVLPGPRAGTRQRRLPCESRRLFICAPPRR